MERLKQKDCLTNKIFKSVTSKKNSNRKQEEEKFEDLESKRTDNNLKIGSVGTFGSQDKQDCYSETKRIKTPRRDKESLSLRLYFHLIRSAFIIMSLMAVAQVIPVYMTVSFYCHIFKQDQRVQRCPISLKFLSHVYTYDEPQIIENFKDNRRIQIREKIIYSNWAVSSVCYFMMIITAVWASTHQKLILTKYSRRVKVYDRSIMIFNIWNQTTSDQLIRYLEGLVDGARIDVVSLTFANSGLGNMNRRRRIRVVGKIVDKLELDMEIHESKKEKKVIKNFIKEYKKWLKVYRRDLKRFENYSLDALNQSRSIAFVTLGTKEQAEIITKKFKKSNLCEWLSLALPSTCCFSCCFFSNNKIKIKKAVHPDELNWNYIGYSRSIRARSRRTSCFLRTFFTFVVFYIIIISNILFLFFIPFRTKNPPKIVRTICSFIPTLIMIIVSNTTSKILEKYERKQIHLMKSKYFIKKVWRVFWMQYINYFFSVLVIFVIEVFKSNFISNIYSEDEYYGLIKFTVTKSVIEPFFTIIDKTYISKAIKIARAKRKLRKAEETTAKTKYSFYTEESIKRVLEKPQMCLSLKYSKIFTVIIIDTLNTGGYFLTPLVSIFYLILQYIADKLFYAKRYRDPNPDGVLVNKNMIEALQILPKIFCFMNRSYLLSKKIKISPTILMLVVDGLMILSIFIPFEPFSEFCFRRIIARRQRRRVECSGKNEGREGDRRREIKGSKDGSGDLEGRAKKTTLGFDLNDFLLGKNQ